MWSAILSIGLKLIDLLFRGEDSKAKARRKFIQFIEARSSWHIGPSKARESEREQIEDLKRRREARNIEEAAKTKVQHVGDKIVAECAPVIPLKGKLAIVVGHTASAAGAYGIDPIGESEYFYNKDLADRVKLLGSKRGHEVEVFFRDSVGISGAYKKVRAFKPDACIELHFNSYNGKVRGSETLHSDDRDLNGVRERAFASIVNTEIHSALGSGRRNRGVKRRPKSKSERGWFNVNQAHNFPSILIEPFFGDNKAEATVAVERKYKIAEAIVGGFEDWLA